MRSDAGARRLRHLSILLLVLGSLIGAAFLPLPQAEALFTNNTHEIEFGKMITFQTILDSQNPLHSIDLFIRPAGENTRIISVPPNSTGKVTVTYDLTLHPLRPFSQVDYWYRATFADSSFINSTETGFFYEDSRFAWKKLDENGFEAAWLEGDLEFGQSILNVIQTSWASVQLYLPADPPLPLRVYIYPSATDLQSALQLTNTPWVAGHASPDLGVVLVSIPAGPDQRAELERQIPHELMHIVEYQKAGAGYSRLPIWLVEGLASIAELYPNQDYERVMRDTISENRLVPLLNLCSDFPHDLSGAFLAYAQSASFTRFLYKNYGSGGLSNLIAQYKDGYGCEEGVRATYGETLAQLETRWKQEYLGLNMGVVVWKNLRPYLLVLLVILIPVVISLIPFRRGKEASK